MRSRFFANISHEFRTPLTLLLGPVEELRRNLPTLSEKNRSLLQTMKRNAQRLQHLINQLLDISKLETGKVKLQVSEGNLTEFIRTIVLSFLSLAETRQIKYHYNIPELSGPVYFDSDKIEKIITNLISNAFKFTSAGGNIKVNLKYTTAEEGDAPLFVEISVRDTGKGIPPEQIDKIFDRFFQVSSSDTREHEGTGIGLSLTKELIDIYRGEIRVESEPGKGSVFEVTLPISSDQFREDEIVLAAEKKPAMIEADPAGLIENVEEVYEMHEEKN